MNYEPNDNFSSLLSIIKNLGEDISSIDEENNPGTQDIKKEAPHLVSEVFATHEKDLQSKMEFYIVLTNVKEEEDEFPYQSWLQREKTDKYNDWPISHVWFNPLIDKMNNTALMLRNIHDLLNATDQSRYNQWQTLWLYESVIDKLSRQKQHNPEHITMFLDALHHTDKVSEYLYALEENNTISELKEIKWTRWSGLELISALNKDDENLIRKNLSLLKTASLEEQISFFDSWALWGKSPYAIRWEKSPFQNNPHRISGFEWDRLKRLVEYDFENKSNFTEILTTVISGLIMTKKLEEQKNIKDGEKINNVQKVQELQKYRNYLELNETIEATHNDMNNENSSERTLKI
jgi:hypothetical protein